MKTVDKAFTVLDQFSLSQSEIGLSELSRMAGIDKAATRRLLVAMAKHGFIEQSEDTRKYRLGHGFLRLASIREAAFPLAKAAQDAVDWLVTQTNETAHASIPGQAGMMTIAHKLPNRGRVINIVPSELLNYHATASGLAFLAFSTAKTAEAIYALERAKLAPETTTTKAELERLSVDFCALGYSHTRNSFEAGVASLAMPFFQKPGNPTGCIALALQQDDLTSDRRDELLPVLRQAVQRVERAITGF